VNSLTGSLLAGVPLAVSVYYAATLMIWLGHYVPHRSKSFVREFHVGGHHGLYPDSRHMRTERFRYGQGRHDSLVPMLPWLFVLAAAAWVALPADWAAFACLEVVAIAAAHSHIHAQFHLAAPYFDRHAWFRRARARHAVHHDRDVNFMVADHFWDRVFRTFEPAK
jgi:hypothetical protein